MPRGKSTGGKPPKRPIETYEHTGKKRINNPPVGLVTTETDPPLPTHKTYEYVAYLRCRYRGRGRPRHTSWTMTRILIPNWYGRGRRSTRLLTCTRFRCTCTSALIPRESLRRCAAAMATACRSSRRCSSVVRKIRRCATPWTSIVIPTAGPIA